MDTIDVVYITTFLYNPSQDTIKFVRMSCSYEDIFTINNENFKIQSRYDCYLNSPTIETLLPKEKKEFHLMINHADKGNFQSFRNFRIGFFNLKYTKEKTANDIVNLYCTRKKQEVIWSNELELDIKKLINISK